MRWKQFFTPVESVDVQKAQEIINATSAHDLNIVDVRQPKEYEKGHIPGAKLVPLPELDNRLKELDPEKATVVYCAVGGRSRAAAQMLSGQGYTAVYNLKGGFKAWNGEAAAGPEIDSLELFSGSETLTDLIVAAYGLEFGLQELYESMQSQVDHQEAGKLFEKLAKIEKGHKERLFQEYRKLNAEMANREDFEQQVVVKALEGGFTTEEVVNRMQPVQGSTSGILDVAMSIEAQALDLYQRAADSQPDKEGRDFLKQLVDEEKSHLAQLGRLMDQVS
ncbi:MAG: sulfurtransferase [Desulfovermiculus sp.]|nr:sulfurtransferase [Desulfovermiculus sp.]